MDECSVTQPGPSPAWEPSCRRYATGQRRRSPRPARPFRGLGWRKILAFALHQFAVAADRNGHGVDASGIVALRNHIEAARRVSKGRSPDRRPESPRHAAPARLPAPAWCAEMCTPDRASPVPSPGWSRAQSAARPGERSRSAGCRGWGTTLVSLRVSLMPSSGPSRRRAGLPPIFSSYERNHFVLQQ